MNLKKIPYIILAVVSLNFGVFTCSAMSTGNLHNSSLSPYDINDWKEYLSFDKDDKENNDLDKFLHTASKALSDTSPTINRDFPPKDGGDFVNKFGLHSSSKPLRSLQALADMVRCPMCGDWRSGKKTADKVPYSAACKNCGSHSSGHLGKQRARYAGKIPNNDLACHYCGCRKTAKNGRSYSICSNCYLTRINMFQPVDQQTWKRDFCSCGSLDGFVKDKHILRRKDPETGRSVRTDETICKILTQNEGFDYYCYNCAKISHVNLTPEQRKYAIAEYLRHPEHYFSCQEI